MTTGVCLLSLEVRLALSQLLSSMSTNPSDDQQFFCFCVQKDVIQSSILRNFRTFRQNETGPLLHLITVVCGFCRFLISILPAAVVAPLYFQGKIEFGVVNQSSSAFNHILGDVSLIVFQVQCLHILVNFVISHGAVLSKTVSCQPAHRAHLPCVMRGNLQQTNPQTFDISVEVLHP